MAEKLRPAYPERLTRAGEALATRLEAFARPVITPYELFLEVRAVIANPVGLFLRSDVSLIERYQLLRKNLRDANIIAPDQNYGHRAYRILKVSDLPADDICCLVDPFCCISHLSAMQRYGLTNKRPEALHLTRPSSRVGVRLLQQMITKKMQADYPGGIPAPSEFIPLRLVKHPLRVRGRPIHLSQNAHPSETMSVRGAFARISTIGQTFLDMIQAPSLCGGILHVIDVWKEHARNYQQEIIDVIDRLGQDIDKVRAGYILDELMNIKDQKIEGWKQYAQRGGSRLLNPENKYASTYSEKWMISLNA